MVCPRIGGDSDEDDGGGGDAGADLQAQDGPAEDDGGLAEDDGGLWDDGFAGEVGGADESGGTRSNLPRSVGARNRAQPLAVLDIAPMLAAGPLAGLRIAILHGRLHRRRRTG